MLTNQHQKVTRCIIGSERQVYKRYMCGVCHALGDDYGLVSRLFTNHETILLNMLTDAQMESPSATVMRRCPLRPTHFVTTNQNTSSRFAAAITVLLINAGVIDDCQDGKGLNLPARLLEKAMSGMSKSARTVLDTLSFDSHYLETLPTQQLKAESDGNNPLAPSMRSSSAIFAMTSELAGSPHNQTALAGIGANYGAYVYLYDALKDWGADYQKGAFNPLIPYLREQSDRVTLTPDGINWLADQFRRILNDIQQGLEQVTFHQHGEVIHKLLTDPIERILNNLAKASNGMSIHKVTGLDVLKTAFLLAGNEPYKQQSMDDFFEDADDDLTNKNQKGRKKGKKNNNGDDSSATDLCCDVGDNSCDLWNVFSCIRCASLSGNSCDVGDGCSVGDGCDLSDGCDVGDCS